MAEARCDVSIHGTVAMTWMAEKPGLKVSAGFQPVGAGILPATRTRVGVHGSVTPPRAIRSRQGCRLLRARSPRSPSPTCIVPA
jgi:hypothetical protein